MARYRFKEFNPKPFTPGARVYWHHEHRADGTVTRRTGVVWSLAPATAGRSAVWVSPDESLPTDLHRLVCVVIPTQRDGIPPWSNDSPFEGGPGWNMYRAEKFTQDIRAENARRAASVAA